MELDIDYLGGMFPVQGGGTIDGERFYFRYRHDEATLYVGGPSNIGDMNDSMPSLTHPRLYAEIVDVTGEYDRGWLSYDEAHNLLLRMIDKLEPFESQETGYDRLVKTVDLLTQINAPVSQQAEDSNSSLDG